MYITRFEKATCDCCSIPAMGVMVEHNGTPTFFQCSVCGPSSWLGLGARQKAAWLAGCSPYKISQIC